MNQPILSQYLSRKLSEILGIPQLHDVTIHFPMNGLISAKVEFLLNEVQAQAIVSLCSDGKWRSNSDE